MVLKKVTKLEDLRARKQKLKEEMDLLDEKIRQAGKDLQKQGLKAYLEEGSTEVPANQELEKLKERLVFLQGVEGKLDELLIRTVRHDRYLAIKRLEADIEKVEKEREKRYSRYKKLQEQIDVLRKESKAFNEQITAKKAELISLRQPTRTVSLRLCELENFLQSNFLLGDELLEKVKKARKHNQEVLKAPKTGDIIFRNFKIKYSLESGKTLDLELLEQDVSSLSRNWDQKGTMTKKELTREVT